MAVGDTDKRPLGDSRIPMFPKNMELVTPADGTVFDNAVCLYVSADGDVQFTPWGGQASVTLAFTAGDYVPCSVRTVGEATTATVYGVW